MKIVISILGTSKGMIKTLKRDRDALQSLATYQLSDLLEDEENAGNIVSKEALSMPSIVINPDEFNVPMDDAPQSVIDIMGTKEGAANLILLVKLVDDLIAEMVKRCTSKEYKTVMFVCPDTITNYIGKNEEAKARVYNLILTQCKESLKNSDISEDDIDQIVITTASISNMWMSMDVPVDECHYVN